MSPSYGDRCPGTNGATGDQMPFVHTVGFLLEVVAQTTVGLAGILMNLLAMYLLATSKRLKSVFNKTLFCLLLVHTFFIIDSLVIEVKVQCVS